MPRENTATRADSATVFKFVQDAYALQHHDYEMARESSLKTLALDSRNQCALSNLGRACEALGDFSKAEEAYRTLIAINPWHTSAYTGLSIVYGKQGRTDEAIANFRKQLEITPRNRYASANLGRAFAFQGKWEMHSRPTPSPPNWRLQSLSIGSFLARSRSKPAAPTRRAAASTAFSPSRTRP